MLVLSAETDFVGDFRRKTYHLHFFYIYYLSERGRNRCGKHGVKINRLFLVQCFVGQQIDLKKYSKPYWQPMKGTKQWKTASKRRLCYQVGQLILYTREAL